MQTRVRFLDVSPLEDGDCYQSAYALCAMHRQEKADSFRQAADRRRCIGAWLLLKSMLSELGVNANREKLAYGENGKPFFSSGTSLRFSLSHAGRFVLCAVSEKETGCDIEQLNRLQEKTVRRCFHREEIDAMECGAVDSPERIWTLKESVAKCTGKGFAQPFDSFSVCANGKLLNTVVLNRKAYHVYEFAVDPQYAAACCTEAQEGQREDIVCLQADISAILKQPR